MSLLFLSSYPTPLCLSFLHLFNLFFYIRLSHLFFVRWPFFCHHLSIVLSLSTYLCRRFANWPCTDNWPGQCIFWLSLWQYELGNWDTAVLKWNKCSFPNSSLFMRPWKSTLPFSWVGCRTGAGGVHPWWLDSVPYPVADLVPPQEIIIKKT